MSSKRSARATKSCSECQRRKQKCSREWPCNHCRTRKIPHLCNFGAPVSTLPKTELNAESGLSSGHDAEQNGIAQASNVSPVDPTEPFGDKSEICESLAQTSLYDVPLAGPSSNRNLQNDTIRNVLETFPSRLILDLVVQDFVANSNYQYCIIHSPLFLEHYVQWWYAKDHDLRIDPRFTCLLIRVLSYALLYLTPNIQNFVEGELGSSTATLAEEYHEAAQRVSMTISPGKGGLVHVQQLLLTSAWLKGQAMLVDAWHALGAAIREAQEIGMHQLPPPGMYSDFEIELRSRVWFILYSWDWQLSRGVSRPLLIDQGNFTMREPNLSSDEDDADPGRPSPFTPMALQGGLVRDLAAKFGRLDEDLSADQAMDYIKEVEHWFETFPPSFRKDDPDTTWDQAHPYIVGQRWLANVQCYLIKVLPLKPYLKKAFTTESSMQDLALREKAVKCCLDIIDVCHSKLDTLLPKVPKQHVATFGIFDTATFLCSAVIHDQLATLPYSGKVFEAIQRSVKTMKKLGESTSLGPKPFQILSRLASSLAIIPADAPDAGPVAKRARMVHNSETDGLLSIDQASGAVTLPDLSSLSAEWRLWQDALRGTFEVDDSLDSENFFSDEI